MKYVTGPITKATGGGLEAVITTPKVDSDGESVDPLGLTNRAEWLTNPLIYWAHEWAFDPSAEPIGKGTSLDVTKAAITSAAEYAPTAKAQNVRALVAGGFVRKTSIGFDPLEMADIKGVPTHTRWALREWSIVPMPANTDATITGTKAALRWFADQFSDPEELAPGVVRVELDPRDLVEALTTAHLTLSADDGGLAIRDGRRVIGGIRPRRSLRLP